MAEQQSGGGRGMRLGVLAVVIFIAAIGGVVAWQYRSVVQDYNRIVEQHMNQGDHQQAATELEALRERAFGPVASQVETSLVQSYLAASDDPGLSIAASAELIDKARRIDPDALNEQHHRVLRSQHR